MGYEAEIRRAIAEKKTELQEDEQFFSSEYYFRFLKQYVTTAIGKTAPNEQVDLDCFAENRTNQTAWTEGHTVHINTRGPLIRDLSTRMLQHYSIIGHIIHECLHIMMTDFSAIKECRKALQQAEWSVVPDNPDAEAVLNDLKKKPLKRKLCVSLCMDLFNIHEDGFIENYGYALFPGVFAAGIHVMDDQLYEKSRAVEEMLVDVKDGMTPLISAVMNCMLLDAMHYPEKSTGEAVRDAETEELYNRLQALLEACRPYTEELRWEKNGRRRVKMILEILCILYPIIPEIDVPQDQQSKSEGSERHGEKEAKESHSQEEDEDSEKSSDASSGSEKGEKSSENGGLSASGSSQSETENTQRSSEEMLEEILNEISASMNQAMSFAPEGEGSQVEQNAGDMTALAIAREQSAHPSENQAAAEREMIAVVNQMIQETAEKAAEQHHCQDLKNEAEELRRKMLHQHGLEETRWVYSIRRKEDPGQEEIQQYQMDFEEVRPWSDPAVRALKRILKEREAAGPEKGYMTGRFSAQSYARNACVSTGNCFTRTSLPIGKPKCVFALCIDQSGSMDRYGKVHAARKTAVLLNEILSSLQIPHLIYGHDDFDETCRLNVFHDFEEPDKKDRYRIEGVSSCGRNRDGAAIAYGCEKLLKRPEKQKILIVISDGLPTENSFHPGMSYEEDAAAVVNDYSRKKLIIFGAVIDGNVEGIRRIYGKHTMDLTDLSHLPQELGSLVSRFLKNSR